MRAKGANVIDHGDGGGHLGPDQNAVIEDTADSGDGASAQSTGKMDPQALGWTKRHAAEKFRADLLAGTKTYTLGACNLLLQLFNLEWIDFKAASMQTDLVPKIVVYSTEKMEELIRLVEEDRQRSTDTGDTRQGLKGAWLDLA